MFAPARHGKGQWGWNGDGRGYLPGAEVWYRRRLGKVAGARYVGGCDTIHRSNSERRVGVQPVIQSNFMISIVAGRARTTDSR